MKRRQTEDRKKERGSYMLPPPLSLSLSLSLCVSVCAGVSHTRTSRNSLSLSPSLAVSLLAARTHALLSHMCGCVTHPHITEPSLSHPLFLSASGRQSENNNNDDPNTRIAAWLLKSCKSRRRLRSRDIWRREHAGKKRTHPQFGGA